MFLTAIWPTVERNLHPPLISNGNNTVTSTVIMEKMEPDTHANMEDQKLTIFR